MINNTYNGKKVLVTGADGFIGSHLTESLVSKGACVTAMTCYNSFGSFGWLDELSLDIRNSLTIKPCDIRDSAHIFRIFEGNEIVFHLAALIGIPYSYLAAQSYVDVNINGTLNLLEAARGGSCGRVIHTSTSEVYGSAQMRPIPETHPLHGQSPYAASKIGADQMAEAYARSHDVPVVILRPFNTYGPRQSERAVIATAIRQMIDNACKEVHLGDITTTRDFNFVNDTVEAFTQVGLSSNISYGEPYNAGSGIETSVSDVVQKLFQITGCNKPLITDTNRNRPKASEVRSLIADSSKLKAATGWKSSMDLDTGLTQTVEWWKKKSFKGDVGKGNEYRV